MVHKFLLWLFIFILFFPAFVGLPALAGLVLRAFLQSKAAWVTAALVLPHFSSKVLDRMYDAIVAGQYGPAVLYAGAFLGIVVGIRSLMKYGVRD